MIEWANGQEAEWDGVPVKIVGCCPDTPGETVVAHPAAGFIRVPTAVLEPRKVNLAGRFRVALMVSYTGNAEVPTQPYIAYATDDIRAAHVESSPDFRKWLTGWLNWNERVAVATP